MVTINKNIVFWVLFLSFTSMSCSGQNKQIINSENSEYKQEKHITMDTVKKLDIEKFYLNQAKYKSAAFILNDSTKIQQFETKECFVEYIMPNGYLFKEYNAYYKNSGMLYETGLVYKDGFIKGVMKTYSESGELIKEEDYDAPFTFTFEDILGYLKDNEMDIYSDRVRVGRYTGNNQDSYWTVECKISDYLIRKTLDGRTGELLKTEKVQLRK